MQRAAQFFIGVFFVTIAFLTCQQQQFSLQGQSPQYQQRGALNARTGAGNADDSLGGSNGSLSSSGGRCREREVVDDRKLHSKRLSGAASSRHVESVGGTQSSTVCSEVASSRNQVGTSLKLMAPTNSGTVSRVSGHSGSDRAGNVQHQALLGASKHGNVRFKGTAGSNPAGSAPMYLATQGFFSDHVPASGGSVGEKVIGQGLNLAGQSTMTNQGARPVSVGQHTHVKASQRLLGSLPGATTPPTGSAVNFQAVLAAAMAKNLQGPHAHRAAPVGGTANANVNAGSSSRIKPSMTGPSASSGAFPMASIIPPSESSGLNPAKSNSSHKSELPTLQKVSSDAVSLERHSSSLAVSSVLSILYPNILAQNMSSKSSHRSQMQSQMQGQSQGQVPGPPKHGGSQSQGSAQTQGPPPQMQQQQHVRYLQNFFGWLLCPHLVMFVQGICYPTLGLYLCC